MLPWYSEDISVMNKIVHSFWQGTDFGAILLRYESQLQSRQVLKLA